jgi:DNA-directed RNA polymerase specialized sigma24 family protein
MRRRPWQGDDSLDADARLTQRIRRERGRDITNAYGDIEDFMEAAILETEEDRIERTRAAVGAEMDFMGKLTPRQAKAWDLFGYQGLSLRETGARMGIHFSTARELLRSAISADTTLEEMRQLIQARAKRNQQLRLTDCAIRFVNAAFPPKPPGQRV